MSDGPPIRHGPHSPFDAQERAAIAAVLSAVSRSGRAEAGELAGVIRQHIEWLEGLCRALSKYPSPLAEQTLGQRRRDLDTLVDILSRTNPAIFDMFLPTRAFLGRAIVMAEGNFYRLLRHVCQDVLAGARAGELTERVDQCLRVCLYTRLCEDVLASIASDVSLDRAVRSRAVVELAQIWEYQTTYRVSDFFPLLDTTWEARRRTTVTGGSLLGASEIVGLFQAGCDPQFVEYFARPALDEDELAAFREFLFGKTTEELDTQARQMQEAGAGSMKLHETIAPPVRDPASVLYGFFRGRHLQAVARRLANLPGPKRTAEEYVMIYYLREMPDGDREERGRAAT